MPFKTAMFEQTHFVFFHGWGFTGACWQFVLPALPENAQAFLCNRGYWGEESAPVLPDAAAVKKIAVAHSLGLHFIRGRFLRDVDCLVLISGFKNFHGIHGRRAMTRKHINRMQARLVKEPQALLEDFYRDCSYPEQPQPISEADISLLQKDLCLLDTSVYAIDSLHEKKVLILHGARDRIVPVSMAEEMHAAIPGSHLQICRQAGHGLPFTHPEFVVHNIGDFLQNESF